MYPNRQHLSSSLIERESAETRDLRSTSTSSFSQSFLDQVLDTKLPIDVNPDSTAHPLLTTTETAASDISSQKRRPRHRRSQSDGGVPVLPPRHPLRSPNISSDSPKAHSVSTIDFPPTGHHRRVRTFSSSASSPRDAVVQHMLDTIGSLKLEHGPNSAPVASVWLQIGNHHLSRKEIQSALEMYKIVQLCEVGEWRAEAYVNMATIYWQYKKDFENALTCLHKALDLRELFARQQGRKPSRCVRVAEIEYQLGMVHSLHGQFDDSIRALTRARSIYQKVHGDMHLDVARCLDSMGKVCLLQQDHELALVYHEDAIRIKTCLSSDWRDHLILVSLFNIATIHHACGDVPGAITSYERILATQEAIFSRTGDSAVETQYFATLRTLDSLYDAQSRS